MLQLANQPDAQEAFCTFSYFAHLNQTPMLLPWTPSQKYFFRFFFVFLALLTIVAYNPLMIALNMSYPEMLAVYAKLEGFVYWIDTNFFHIGFEAGKNTTFFSNTYFGVVLTIFIFFASIISSFAWTIAAKPVSNYNHLYYWFCNYLAYYIFLAMSTYAMYKVFPTQTSYPTAPQLLARWGDLPNWEILFRFMGTSPGYSMFCGWLELIASVLILFNRWRVVGALLMATITFHIVLLNVFYNNNVIMLAASLWLCSMFMLARTFPKLYRIFIRQKPVSLAETRYFFSTPWKKYVMIALCFIPAYRFVHLTIGSWQYYSRQVHNEKNQRLFNVTSYEQDGLTIPPLTTDTVRWKYVCFIDYSPTNKHLVKFDMKENSVNLIRRVDSTNQVMTFINRRDTTSKSVFHFTNLPNGNFMLSGRWKGSQLRMELTEMSIDSMTLVKDKFAFIQE
ncbi:MAG: hypothetical protein H7Y31_03200 [Chitinophagaceae bacterium]|nr:hypothetical protein [Chitinophagaceae bacterium]